MKKEKVIEIKPIDIKKCTVTLVGDSDIVLNKMNDVMAKRLIDQRKDKAKDMSKPNEWEEIITAVHWKNPLPDDRENWSKETMFELLNPDNNAPCITAFGLKKSWMAAVVRNEIDTYSTKFDASVNVIAEGGNVPIRFEKWTVDEKLMSPKKGSPVLAKLNRFTNWSTDVTIQYTENTYSLEQILNIINLSGFGGGIGSGRSSGYGRYHIGDVK